jgi:hypothetical protein
MRLKVRVGALAFAALATVAISVAATADPAVAMVTAVSGTVTSGVHVGADPTFKPGAGWVERTAAQEHVQVSPLVPNGFQPLTASAADLAKYGLPARPPASTPALAAWKAVMERFKREAPDRFFDVPATPTRVPATIGPNTLVKNTTWSGNVDPYNGSTYTIAQANWTEPTVTATASSSGSYIWVGMQGHCAPTCAQLPQDGTSQGYSGGRASYSAWYQVCCTANPLPKPLSLTVSPNMQMFFETDLYGPTEAEFFACGGSTCIQPIKEAFTGPPAGGEADFIVEKNGSQMLADFGQVNFTSAYDEQNGTFQCVGTPAHWDYHMYTNSSYTVQISSPGAFTDSNGCNFPVTRINPGS